MMLAIVPVPVACPVVLHLTEGGKPDTVGLGGLIALGTGTALPLREVRVRTTLVGHCARTVVEQRFGNDLKDPVEAVHIFPLPPAGAVVEMELRAGDTVVVAECRERQEAERTFNEARQAGHRAALLTQERDDVHTLRVARIPPGAEIVVRLVLVQALEAQDGLFRYRFPTVLAPRYVPGTAVGHTGPGVDADTDRAPDASRLSPPLRLSGGTKFDLEVEIAGAVSELQCSLHTVAMKFGAGSVRIAPSGKATLDRDFVLAYGLADSETSALRAFTDGTHTLVVACAPRDRTPPALARDAVFVVDISGSMEGQKMTAAKAALTAALHGLLPGDRFRLVAFDDRLEHFKADFVDYGDATLAAADRWIGALAPRGGTEMLPAIQTALTGTTPTGRLRTVLFITDGQAQNEAELVAAVANRRGTARFFTLGIDTAVNEALMTRLARVGGGVCELATPEDDIEETVARLESRFGLPLVDGLLVERGESGGDPARPEPGVLFGGRPATMLIAGAPATVRVRGVAAGGAFTAEAVPEKVDFPIGVLWARERIASLEDRLILKPFEEEALRPEILRLGLLHHLATKYTAFVAVERTQTIGGDLKEVVVPVELPQGWSEDFKGGASVTRAGSISPSAMASFGAPGGAPPAPPPPSAPMPMSAPRMMRSMPSMPVMAPSASMAAPPPAPSPKKAAPPPSVPGGGGLLGRAIGGLKDALGFGGAGGAGGIDKGDAEEESQKLMDMAPMESMAEIAADLSVADDLADGFAAPAKAESKKAKRGGETVAAFLARTQSADGSYGGDVLRTAAALLALLVQGHTRRSGARARVVLKAATWLEAHRGAHPAAALVLDLLSAAERGEPVERSASWADLEAAGEEGERLVEAVAGR